MFRWVGRRWIAGGLALYALVVASGAPLPLDAVRLAAGQAASAERFPCENCPCGCSTAARCWSNCCCHTLPQRLAWAKRERVRPPESALDEAAATGLDIRPWRPDAAVAPVVEVEVASLPPCCRAKAACCATPAEPRGRQREARPPGVAILKALACQGVEGAWLDFGEAPPVQPADGAILLASSQALTIVAPFEAPLVLGPEPPPPRG